MNWIKYATKRLVCLVKSHDYDRNNKIYTPDWFDAYSESGVEQRMTLKSLCVRCGDYVRIPDEK